MPSTPLKIIFAGTPAFAAVSLKALLHSPHQVIAVYTQPDRPAGRGLKVTASEVKTVAMEYQLPIQQPQSLKDAYEQDTLAHFKADVMVVAAYSQLLPSAVLAIPPLGCINVHPSLLPRWRGAAPIQRTIFAGDSISGVTIMQMDAGLDTGPILLQKQYVLDPQETAQTLQTRLAALGAEALIETLNLLSQQKMLPKSQDNTKATYAHKISKEEALIDWTQSAVVLDQIIRAFNPWPVAYTSWQNQSLRLWQAKPIAREQNLSPRTLVHASQEGIDIATGCGTLRLLSLQLPGGKIISAADFYNAHRNALKEGEKFI